MLEPVIACPVCSERLHANDNRWSCTNNHSFDQARYGYLNLLLAQHKKSKAPGDNLDMVDARQRLLDSQLYQPISDMLNQWVVDLALSQQEGQAKALHIADIGCGEGYYTQRLQDSLSDHQIEHRMYGVDISKDALRRAARRSKNIDWLVVAEDAHVTHAGHALDGVLQAHVGVVAEELGVVAVVIAEQAHRHPVFFSVLSLKEF